MRRKSIDVPMYRRRIIVTHSVDASRGSEVYVRREGKPDKPLRKYIYFNVNISGQPAIDLRNHEIHNELVLRFFAWEERNYYYTKLPEA